MTLAILTRHFRPQQSDRCYFCELINQNVYQVAKIRTLIVSHLQTKRFITKASFVSFSSVQPNTTTWLDPLFMLFGDALWQRDGNRKITVLCRVNFSPVWRELTLETIQMAHTLITIPAIAVELDIAYQTAYRWVVDKQVVPSEFIGNLRVVKREDFERFAADYRAGKYERWPR
jgi:hypothetical protein